MAGIGDEGGGAWPPPHWDFGMPDLMPPADQGASGLDQAAPIPPSPDPGAQFADAMAGQGAAPMPIDPGVEMLPLEQPPLPPDVSAEASQAPAPWMQNVANTANDIGNAVTGNTPLPTAEDPWAPKAPPPTPEEQTAAIDHMSEAEQLAYAQTHPAAWRDYTLHKDVLAQTDLQKKQIDLNLQQSKDSFAELQQYHRAVADVTAKRQALYDEASKLSADGGYWANRSGFGKVVDVLSAAIGGIIQGRQGGSNMGLDIINQNIQRSVEAERARITQKGSILNQLTAQLGDQHAAEQALTIASYQVAGNKLMAEAANSEPGGTRQRALVNAKLGMDAQIQRLSKDGWTKDLKTQLDFEKSRAETNKTLADTTKTQLETAKLAGQLGGGPVSFEKTPVTEASLKARGVENIPPHAFFVDDKGKQVIRTQGEVEKWQASKGKDIELGNKEGAGRVGARGEYMNADGTEWKAPEGPEGEKLREKVALAKQISANIDEAKRLRTGWSNSLYNRHEYEQIKTDMANNMANLAKFNDVKLSKKTEDLVEEMMGGDATKFMDHSEGLEAGKRSVVGLTDNMMRAAHWNPKPGETFADHVPDLSSKGEAPKNDRVDDLLQEGLSKQHNWREKNPVASSLWSLPFTNSNEDAKKEGTAARVLAVHQLEHMLSVPGANADKIKFSLEKIKADGPTKDERDAAQEALDKFNAKAGK